MKTIAGGKDLINQVIPKHRLKQGDSLRTRYSMGGDDTDRTWRSGSISD